MVERRSPLAVKRPRATSGRAVRASASPWWILRVIMVSKGGEELVDPPGRDLLVKSSETFADLAKAIDRAFARWDVSHLHEFRFLDGRRVMMMEGVEEFEDIDASRDLDETQHSLATSGLAQGDTFVYAFDFGDNWEHECTVLRTNVDPVKEAGIVPSEIVPVFGWGTIPDQYGRLSMDEDE